MAKYYKDKLRICPFILHANIIRFAVMAVHGYKLTEPEGTICEKCSECIGDRCMFYEREGDQDWCRLSNGRPGRNNTPEPEKQKGGG